MAQRGALTLGVQFASGRASRDVRRLWSHVRRTSLCMPRRHTVPRARVPRVRAGSSPHALSDATFKSAETQRRATSPHVPHRYRRPVRPAARPRTTAIAAIQNAAVAALATRCPAVRCADDPPQAASPRGAPAAKAASKTTRAAKQMVAACAARLIAYSRCRSEAGSQARARTGIEESRNPGPENSASLGGPQGQLPAR